MALYTRVVYLHDEVFFAHRESTVDAVVAERRSGSPIRAHKFKQGDLHRLAAVSVASPKLHSVGCVVEMISFSCMVCCSGMEMY